MRDKSVQRKLWRFLNIGLALFLLWLVLREVGIYQLADVLRNANFPLILLVIVTAPPLLITSSYKWYLLLKAQGVNTSLKYLFQLYLIGTFFNNFLPSSVGGDVVRIMELGRKINDPATAAASIFVERLTGFIVLIGLACVAFLVRFLTIDSLPLRLLMLGAAGGIIAIAWVAFDARLLRLAERYLRFAPVNRLVAKFAKFQTALHRYASHPKVIGVAVFWSLVFYARAMIVTYITASAFAPEVSFVDIAFIVPITMTVAAVPFSINGLGVLEWSYVLLFPTIGLPASVGLSTILVTRIATLVTVGVGGLVYLHTHASSNDNSPVASSSAL